MAAQMPIHRNSEALVSWLSIESITSGHFRSPWVALNVYQSATGSAMDKRGRVLRMTEISPDYRQERSELDLSEHAVAGILECGVIEIDSGRGRENALSLTGL